MTRAWSQQRRRSAWVIGGFVLAAAAGSVTWLLRSEGRMLARLAPTDAPAPAAAPVTPLPVALGAPAARPAMEATVRGVVRAPHGAPVPSADVRIYRLLTAWPEWRREEPIDRAVTGNDGAFQFAVPDVRGLVIGVRHPRYAEALVEVPLHGEWLDVPLQPGFELSGSVLTETGGAIANVAVAVEALPGDHRRVLVTRTTNSGAFRFTNVAAGPVRLVARHDDWQPASQPVVVGDQLRAELRFTRPAMPPLTGTVMASDGPVAGALVDVLPINGKLGLVDTRPVRTDARGAFAVAGLPRGAVRVLVRHADHGASTTTLTIGAVAAPRLFELPRRSLVAGRLAAPAGERPWRGEETLRIRDSAGQIEFTSLAADGTFRFGLPLSPGWASVQVLDQAFAFQRSATAEVDVRIEETATTELALDVVAPSLLRGRVVDGDGAPLAGASLTRTKLLTEDLRNLTDAAVQFDLGQVGSQVAQLFASDRDELLATTGADGTFEIRAAKPGPLLLRASRRGAASKLLTHTVGGTGAVADLGDVVLPPGRRMHGLVRRGGRPFAGASVLVVGVGGTAAQSMAVTDAFGAWSVDDLPPGDYRVRARLPSQPLGSSVRNERVEADGPTRPPVQIVLDPGRVVRGEVLDTQGQPLAGAIVSVRGVAGAVTSSDASGEFALELPERARELQVALADRSRSTLVAVPGDDARLTVRLDTPPTCTITATVAGLPGRKRLESAVLRLVKVGAAAGEEVRTRWLELTDGQLQWTLCPAGRVRVEVWCEGYAPAVLEREFTANAEHSLGDLLLEPGARLSGSVRRGDGTPVGNAVVLLGEEADLELFDGATRTAADGSFGLSGVSSRSRRLVARAPGFAPRVVDLVLPNDVLSPTPLVVTLEPGTSIEVRLDRRLARDGGFVQLRRDGRLVAAAEIGDDGKVVFANRSPGAYVVQLDGGGAGKPVVVEPGAAAVQVQLP